MLVVPCRHCQILCKKENSEPLAHVSFSLPKIRLEDVVVEDYDSGFKYFKRGYSTIILNCSSSYSLSIEY